MKLLRNKNSARTFLRVLAEPDLYFRKHWHVFVPTNNQEALLALQCIGVSIVGIHLTTLYCCEFNRWKGRGMIKRRGLLTQSEYAVTLMHDDLGASPTLQQAATARKRPPAASIFAIAVFLTLIFCGLCMQPAQAVQRLHVSSFTISTDRRTAATTDLVQLTIRAKINERIDSIENLTLPDMPGFQIASNEQHATQNERGTDFLQTITLIPQAAGHYEIGPVAITAIDSASSSSIPIKFETQAPAVIDVTEGEDSAQTLQRNIAVPVVTAICIGFAFFFGRMWFTSISDKLAAKRIAAAVPPPKVEPVEAEPLVVPPTRLQRLQAAMKHAHRDPTRQNALELRAALRDALDAGPDETLSDIMIRLPDGERGLYARALRAVERAAFIDDHERTTAIEDGLVVIEAARDRLEKEPREYS